MQKSVGRRLNGVTKQETTVSGREVTRGKESSSSVNGSLLVLFALNSEQIELVDLLRRNC